MKRFLIALLAGTILLAAAATGWAAAVTWNGYTVVNVTLHGEPFVSDPPGILVEGSTFLPLRALAEALGLTVTWEQATMTAHLSKPAVALTGVATVLDGDAQRTVPAGSVAAVLAELKAKPNTYLLQTLPADQPMPDGATATLARCIRDCAWLDGYGYENLAVYSVRVIGEGVAPMAQAGTANEILAEVGALPNSRMLLATVDKDDNTTNASSVRGDRYIPPGSTVYIGKGSDAKALRDYGYTNVTD